MSFRERDEFDVLDSGGGGDGIDGPDEERGEGPGGSCWGECGRDAPEGKRLCQACAAEGHCATCAGYGSVGGPEVIDGRPCLVSRTCPECGGGD